MRSKVLNTIFVLAFMIVLVSPLLFVDFSGGGVSKSENRNLAARPSVSQFFDQPIQFVHAFDAWFADNVGFREDFISLYGELNEIETQGAYQEGNETYLIGKEGHRYYAGKGGTLIKKYQGEDPLSEEEMSMFSIRLQESKEFLEEKGIPMIFMVCTDKETVYPEYYPDSIIQGSAPYPVDRFIDRLKRSGIDAFNTRERLVDEKQYDLLYNKVDDVTHFNTIGAFFSYRELMKHVNTYYPELTALPLDEVSFSYENSAVPQMNFKNEVPYTKLGDVFFDSVEVKRPYVGENSAYQNTDESLPTALLICDSFAWTEHLLAGYVPIHFGKTIFIHYKNVRNLSSYIETYAPDLVVFEVAERGIQSFAGAIKNVPEFQTE